MVSDNPLFQPRSEVRPARQPRPDIPVESYETVMRGGRIAGLLPELQDAVNTSKRQIEKRVYAAIKDGSFTPNMAFAAWLEYEAAEKVLRNLTQQVKVGASQGEKFAETLNSLGGTNG